LEGLVLGFRIIHTAEFDMAVEVPESANIKVLDGERWRSSLLFSGYLRL